MLRVTLRSIQPGDRLLRIEEQRLVGPRGGRYVFPGMTPRHGGPMEFERYELSPDGKTRTFHFKDANPLAISDALSCKLVAQIEDRS